MSKKIVNKTNGWLKRKGVRIAPLGEYIIPDEESWFDASTLSDVDGDILGLKVDDQIITNKSEIKEELRKVSGDDRSIVRSIMNVLVKSTSYKTIGSFIFRGTSIHGSDIYGAVIANIQSGSSAKFRIYDTTNNKVIYESGLISNVLPDTIPYSGLSNLPVDVANFDIQITSGNKSKKAYMNYFEMRW